MKKFESLQYLKRIGLPICTCRKYIWYDYNKAIQFADCLRKKKLGAGLRTELVEGDDPGRDCPFIINISNEQIYDTFLLHKNRYHYILSEAPGVNNVVTQGVAYLLPNRVAVIYANEINKCTCRAAIEDPLYNDNVKSHIRNWYSPVKDKYTVVRNYLVEASKKDGEIIGKRIEWSLYKKRGYIFWQLSEDSKFQNLPGVCSEN